MLKCRKIYRIISVFCHPLNTIWAMPNEHKRNYLYASWRNWGNKRLHLSWNKTLEVYHSSKTNLTLVLHCRTCCNVNNERQGSLFSKAYRPLAQHYFSAGPLPPPLLHPLLGGGSTFMFTLGGGSTSMFMEEGVHFCVHFLGGGSTSMFTSGGGVHFHVHFWGVPVFTSGGVYFCVHFWGGPMWPIP